MKRNHLTWTMIQLAVVAALGGSLAACGGGGDGGGPTLVDITAANRDALSHAAATGVLAMSFTGGIPIGGSSQTANREWAQAAGQTQPSVWSGLLLALPLQALRAQGASAGRTLERALALLPPVVEPCTISGTTTTTVDDRDNSLSLTVGDIGTVTFNNCKDTASETLNGTTTLTFTAASATSLSARATLAQLAIASTNHALTLNGAALLDLSTPDPNGPVLNTRMTADGPVRAAINIAHLPFIDTVTLESGFVVNDSFDSSVAPPVGTTPLGRNITTVGGNLTSVAGGGTVAVSTVANAPLTSYSAEAYPRSGAVQVKGNKGTLVLTALSAASVRLDLDAADDGTFELVETKTWDWVL